MSQPNIDFISERTEHTFQTRYFQFTRLTYTSFTRHCKHNATCIFISYMLKTYKSVIFRSSYTHQLLFVLKRALLLTITLVLLKYCSKRPLLLKHFSLLLKYCSKRTLLLKHFSLLLKYCSKRTLLLKHFSLLLKYCSKRTLLLKNYIFVF